MSYFIDSEEAQLVWKNYQKKLKKKKGYFIRTPGTLGKSFAYEPLNGLYLTKKVVNAKAGKGQNYYEDEAGNKYLYCQSCEKIKELNDNNFYKQRTKIIRYRTPCKSCEKLIQKFKRDTNPKLKERMNEDAKKWRNNNKERFNENQRNLQREKMKDPEYREKSNEYQRKYLKNKRANDPAYKLACNVSKLVRIAIQRVNEGKTSKGGKTFEHLPYTPQELVEHLESQFDENMSWDNYGTYWHIDHIIPQAMFPYDSVKHPNFQKVWALDNLQPLEALENISKNSIYKGKKRYYNNNK